MFLDESGAISTNLVDSDTPNDIYKDVADRALATVQTSSNKLDKLIVGLNEVTEGKLSGLVLEVQQQLGGGVVRAGDGHADPQGAGQAAAPAHTSAALTSSDIRATEGK